MGLDQPVVVPEAGASRAELAAIVLRGHAHPSLPQVAFYQVESLEDGQNLRSRCLDRSETLTFTVTHPLFPGRLHVFDVKAGVPVAIHYFPSFSNPPDSDLSEDQQRYLNDLARQISTLHQIENKDGAPIVLPWVYVIQIVGGQSAGERERPAVP